MLIVMDADAVDAVEDAEMELVVDAIEFDEVDREVVAVVEEADDDVVDVVGTAWDVVTIVGVVWALVVWAVWVV